MSTNPLLFLEASGLVVFCQLRVSVVIHSIEAFFLTPWLSSRAGKLNPVAIFTGVLVWGWLWGAWGLLLGMPIMMVVKAVCDRADSPKPVSELLSD